MKRPLKQKQNELFQDALGQPRIQGCLSTALVQGEDVLHFDSLIKKAECQVENTRKPRDNHCEDELSSLLTVLCKVTEVEL